MTPRIKVTFRSSFRGDWCPCISHETLDRVRTLCGRDVAEAVEVAEETERDMDPDCRTCCKRLEKLRRARTK